MQYNRLGRAGIKVSELSFGSWLTFGGNLDATAAQQLMRRAFDLGVNFFDNAEVYPTIGVCSTKLSMRIAERSRSFHF